MANHYCIANPCWICYPEYAPKSTEKNYTFFCGEIDARKIPESGISELVCRLLIKIFDQGLDEGTHEWTMPGLNTKLEDLEKERLNVSENSLEAKLLDLLIEKLKS